MSGLYEGVSRIVFFEPLRFIFQLARGAGVDIQVCAFASIHGLVKAPTLVCV